MANLTSLIKSCNPDPTKAGKTLLILNAVSMVFAAASNTFAAAVDKNTSAEDKKFLVPAGLVTGVANIGLYYAMTDKLIKKFKDAAGTLIDSLSEKDKLEKATQFANKQIEKAENGGIFGFGKKSDEYVASMRKTLFKENNITNEAKKLYKNKAIAGSGVLGAFVGAVVGCAVLTPIIRDVSAYFVQKKMEKMNPELKDQPYKPYLNPMRMSNSRFSQIMQKQPLSMKNYMAFTNSDGIRI